jgi:hypothetical protein
MIQVELPQPVGVVFHHSECRDTPGLETLSIRDWHVNGNHWRDIGYNFVVEETSGHVMVVCGREPFLVGAHCRGHNNMLGVCLVGNFDLNPPSEVMLDKTARLLKWLLLDFRLPTTAVYDHRDLNDTTCPGKLFAVKRDIVPRL